MEMNLPGNGEADRIREEEQRQEILLNRRMELIHKRNELIQRRKELLRKRKDLFDTLYRGPSAA